MTAPKDATGNKIKNKDPALKPLSQNSTSSAQTELSFEEKIKRSPTIYLATTAIAAFCAGWLAYGQVQKTTPDNHVLMPESRKNELTRKETKLVSMEETSAEQAALIEIKNASIEEHLKTISDQGVDITKLKQDLKAELNKVASLNNSAAEKATKIAELEDKLGKLSTQYETLKSASQIQSVNPSQFSDQFNLSESYQERFNRTVKTFDLPPSVVELAISNTYYLNNPYHRVSLREHNCNTSVTVSETGAISARSKPSCILAHPAAMGLTKESTTDVANELAEAINKTAPIQSLPPFFKAREFELEIKLGRSAVWLNSK